MPTGDFGPLWGLRGLAFFRGPFSVLREVGVWGLGLGMREFTVCMQCARGGCASLGMGARPLIRELASACSPAATTPTIFNSGLGFTPSGAPDGGFLALCFLSRLRHINDHKPQLRWIGVGLWVLTASAGCSTRSKGSQQTPCPSRPVRVARPVPSSVLYRVLWEIAASRFRVSGLGLGSRV